MWGQRGMELVALGPASLAMASVPGPGASLLPPRAEQDSDPQRWVYAEPPRVPYLE